MNTYFVMSGADKTHPAISIYVGQNLIYASEIANWWTILMPDGWTVWIESIDENGIPHVD